jgi:hypothetical protein
MAAKDVLLDVLEKFNRHIKESGELFDASISLNLVVLNDKKYTQAVLRDITEKKAIQVQGYFYSI